MVTPDSDDELMARIAAGDAQAFALLYERWSAPVHTFLVRLVGDRHLAEDLLQESFLRLWRARHEYQAAARFRAWLFTITRRLVIDRARQARIAWEDDPAALDRVIAPERADHRQEAREVLGRVERALADLAPAQREVVLLSRVAGMSAEEIAEVIGSTPGAVRVALHRALRRLAALLGEGSG